MRPGESPAAAGVVTEVDGVLVALVQVSEIAGVEAGDLHADHVPDEVKEERYHRFMETQAAISEAKLAGKVGRTLEVLADRRFRRGFGHLVGRPSIHNHRMLGFDS